MSSRSAAGDAVGGRKVATIRPAVPLIYEPRPRGGGKASTERKPVSRASSRKSRSIVPAVDQSSNPTYNAQEQPCENPGLKLSSNNLRSPETLEDVSTEICKVITSEARDMERDRLQILQYSAGDPEEENEQSQQAKAASYEASERSTTGRSVRRLILGIEVEESGFSMESEDSMSEAAVSHLSSTKGKTSSVSISENTKCSTGTSPEATGTGFDRPVTYPPPNIQFGDYVNEQSLRQPYANQYMFPQYDPQAQHRFTKPWNEVPQFHPIGGKPPPTPSSASLDDGTTPFDPKLAGHISSNFNVQRYADVRLIVAHERERFQETTLFLHRILAARSETLRGLLDECAGNFDKEDGKLVVRINFNDRYITPTALAAAIQTCYGQPALKVLSTKVRGRADCDRNLYLDDMHGILAFVAAGHFLKLEDVALRGIEKAQEALNWETVDCALKFGMESCIHRRGSPEALLLGSFCYPGPEGDQISINSATFMLESSLSFIASSFPDSWILDRSASELPIVDRLPVAGELPKPRIRSKLARIQLGQLPPEVDPKVTDRDALLSSILLSVPFENLCYVVASKPPSLICQLPQVIEERERRRLVALNSEIHWNQRRLGKQTTWHAVGFQESFTPGDPNDGALGLACSPLSIYSAQTEEEDARKEDEASLGLI